MNFAGSMRLQPISAVVERETSAFDALQSTPARRAPPWLAVLVQKLSRSNLQRLRQFVQRSKRKIFFGSFNGPDIGSVEIAPGGEFFLRPAPTFAEFSHISRDDLNRLGLRHAS